MTRVTIEYMWNEFVYCQDWDAADICQAALDGDAGALQWVAAEACAMEMD